MLWFERDVLPCLPLDGVQATLTYLAEEMGSWDAAVAGAANWFPFPRLGNLGPVASVEVVARDLMETFDCIEDYDAWQAAENSVAAAAQCRRWFDEGFAVPVPAPAPAQQPPGTPPPGQQSMHDFFVSGPTAAPEDRAAIRRIPILENAADASPGTMVQINALPSTPPAVAPVELHHEPMIHQDFWQGFDPKDLGES